MQTSLRLFRIRPLQAALGLLGADPASAWVAAKTNADSQGALGAYDPLCTRPDERTLKLGQGAKNRQHQLAARRRGVGQCISANDLKLAPALEGVERVELPP
jgi:hypothetical protein